MDNMSTNNRNGFNIGDRLVGNDLSDRYVLTNRNAVVEVVGFNKGENISDDLRVILVEHSEYSRAVYRNFYNEVYDVNSDCFQLALDRDSEKELSSIEINEDSFIDFINS